MFIHPRNYGNVDQNNFEISSYPGRIVKTNKQQILERNKKRESSFPVGGLITNWFSHYGSQRKAFLKYPKNKSTILPCYTVTPYHIHKGLNILLHRYLISYVHCYML